MATKRKDDDPNNAAGVAHFWDRVEQYAAHRRRHPVLPMVLGLDPGVHTGYAYAFLDPQTQRIGAIAPDHIGVWNLAMGRFDSGPSRLIKLRQLLYETKPDLVYVEGSPITMSSILASGAGGRKLTVNASAIELLAMFRGEISSWCEWSGVPCLFANTSSIKKHATGKGNANKLDMIRACNARFGTVFPAVEDQGYDNAADAAFICSLALLEVGGALFGLPRKEITDG